MDGTSLAHRIVGSGTDRVTVYTSGLTDTDIEQFCIDTKCRGMRVLVPCMRSDCLYIPGSR